MTPDEFQNAVRLFQAGAWAQAAEACRALLQRQPRHADAWQLLGMALIRSGDLPGAVPPLEEARRLQPRHPHICNNLGELYRQVQRLAESEQLLREALALLPQFPEAAFNLGNTLKELGRPGEAVVCFQQAVGWRPDYAKAHLNLANTLRAEGRVPRAVQHYRRYLELQPARLDVVLSLAACQADLGEHEEARTRLQQAAALSPDSPDVEIALGNAAHAQGDAAAARGHYRQLAAREPASLLRQLRAAVVAETIPPSRDDIAEYTARLAATLSELAARRLELDPAALHASGAEPPMALAYYGIDERPLKESYAALFSDRIRPLELRPRTGRPHAGVVVTHGHEGVYAECLGRLVQRLASPELDVTVVCSQAGANILNHLLGDVGQRYLVIPDRVDEAARLMVDAGFDALLYWEIGTDSQNYFLPFFRPAPIQCNCWGWPTTSAQPHVTHFLSSSLLEPPDGQAHYTEQLVLLDTLPTWYVRPPVPRTAGSRAAAGFAEAGRAYLCTQNLRKYHPDFDDLLGELLRRDPAGRVYVINDAQPAISRRLHARFARTLPDVVERIVFLPRRERAAYLEVVAQADVVLDTLHYGGGANSLYDAFACGTPVVTCPGRHHRSRYALAAYRRMDIPDLVASSPAEYVDLALRVASDADYRQDLRRRIQSASDVLFEDPRAVTAVREFLLTAISQARM